METVSCKYCIHMLRTYMYERVHARIHSRSPAIQYVATLTYTFRDIPNPHPTSCELPGTKRIPAIFVYVTDFKALLLQCGCKIAFSSLENIRFVFNLLFNLTGICSKLNIIEQWLMKNKDFVIFNANIWIFWTMR